MSLYDGIDLEEKQKADLAGWGSSLKLLETQKQLQEKKMMLQSLNKKKNNPTLTPVISLKNRRGEDGHNQVESMGGLFGSYIGDVAFVGIVDEYDPMKPNDYEKIVKSKKQNSNDDDRSRHDDHHRSSIRNDEDDGYKHRPPGWRNGPLLDDRKRRDRSRRDEDDYDSGSAAKIRKSESESSMAPKAAIAPPPSLIEADDKKIVDFQGPVLNKPEPPGSQFGLSGSVASKIMARMGYKEGQGLGKQEQGMSIALQVEKTSKKIGKIIHEKDLHKSQDLSVPRAEMSNANLLRNPSKVIMLQNMVAPGDVDDMLETEVSEECAKYGKVVKCVIFEIPDAIEEEAVRIFVEFDRLEASIKAVVDLNGRFFGGRVVKGNFYNIDKFKQYQLGDDVD
ncbi:hypothetical protein HELRODRAFT_192221 [Helobdella robusta]|uniref:Splicing factor 45 n=1 Tax=Helobdella robusta TaxID=6412 RepID=T1FTQ4_HELRO|nr:hypothetical protein HELRODRAFT_192221 [Helobdella robusta]ESO01644.1 hypothetical protein HELRODRAFT_192221 [Helobdella robusta]